MLFVFPVLLVMLIEWRLGGGGGGGGGEVECEEKERAMKWTGLNELTSVVCFPSCACQAS